VALFNGLGSLEIRAVTDAADKDAPPKFDENLPIAMANFANLLRSSLDRQLSSPRANTLMRSPRTV